MRLNIEHSNYYYNLFHKSKDVGTVAITQCCSQQFIAHLQLYLHLHRACRRTDGGKLSMGSQEPFSLVEDRA